MHDELLVTGCYRSGTTLLEKLLHSNPEACVASQPFPALYHHAKALFDAELGLSQRYPLGHRFLEDRYSDADFASFLGTRPLDASDIDTVFEQLDSHAEGHWTRAILSQRRNVQPGRFLEVYRQLMQAVSTILTKQRTRVLGSKEVLLEEYVPYFLDHGLRVVLILRDPRDMVASVNFNKRDSMTGGNRPVLYSMRVWRKSVATALAFEDHPRFHWLRYEDLVDTPSRTLARLAEFLQLPNFPDDILAEPLRDQHGQEWTGNSSFRDQAGVSRSSAGRFRTVLPPAVLEMIETVAGPEMRFLGYTATGHDRDRLKQYCDPFEQVHGRFPADYSADPRRIADEIKRLDLLDSSASMQDDDARRWFIYPTAYRKLCAAARPT